MEQVVFWDLGRGQYMGPSRIHSVLVVTPEVDVEQGSENAVWMPEDWKKAERQWWETVDNSGWVFDPTFLQYGFETAIRPVAEYLWDRVEAGDNSGRTTSQYNSVALFGDRFDIHEKYLQGTVPGPRTPALVTQVCMLAMNEALFEQILQFGGREELFSCRHEQFCKDQLLIEQVVGRAVRQARASTDDAYFQHPVDTVADLQELMEECEGFGHSQMMRAFRDLRLSQLIENDRGSDIP